MEENDNDCCENCGSPKLFPDKPCIKCDKNNSKPKTSRLNFFILIFLAVYILIFAIFANLDNIFGPDYSQVKTQNLKGLNI